MNTQTITKKGFTLLELLIVISIIAILSVILIVALNPAETLKKARDTQRISDLASLKTALGIYATTVGSPDLDAGVTDFCLGQRSASSASAAGANGAKIGYSLTGGSPALTACVAVPTVGTDKGTLGGGGSATQTTFNTTNYCAPITAVATSTLVDGTGWIPVNLSAITGGSPISNLPIDPTNTVATANTPINTDLVYRYACQNTHVTEDGTSPTQGPDTVFEVDARLESATYGVSGTDDRSSKDGGDNATLYEAGTSLKLMGNSNNY